jgi:hypothetical protein
MRRTAAEIKKQLHLMDSVGSDVSMGMIAEIRIKIAPHESLVNLPQQIIAPIPLTGGFYKELAPAIKNKEAIINIKNSDQLCFQYCVICHKLDYYAVRNPDRVTHYQMFEDGTPLRQGVRKAKVPKDVGVDFSMLTFPVQLEDIDAFEATNNLGVFVYGYTQSDNSLIIVVYRAPQKQYKDELKLMLDEGHYSLIKNWSRLQSMRSRSCEMRDPRCKKCPTCLTEYYSKELFERHIKERRCVKAMQGRPIQQCVLPPAQDKNGFKPVVRYKPSSELALHPCVVYADIEVFSNKADPDKADSNINQNTVASYAYTAVGRDFTPSDEHIYRLRRYGSSDDIMVEMIKSLFALYDEFLKAPQYPLVMTEEDQNNFDDADTCHYCSRSFNDNKVRDHNHLTGKYRCAACSYCNLQVQLPSSIPVFFHNGEGYDFHFLVHAITRFKQIYGGTSVQLYREGDKTEKLVRKIPISIISRTAEKYMKIRFGPLVFLDSFKMQSVSLGELIEAQRKLKPDIRDCFPILTRHHPYISRLPVEQMSVLLDAKMRMPFEAMTGPDCFDKPALFEKADYNSRLAKDISDEGYETIKRNIDALGLQNFGEYHDAYLYSDLSLADVMESFREAFFNKFGIDIVHNVSIPSASWHAMLKTTNVKLDLIPNTIEGQLLHEDVKNNIRGGMSCMFQPYAKAGPDESILYIDAVSLYPTMMREELPVGGFKLVPTSEYETLLKNKTPCMFVVDFHVPADKHDFFDWAPAYSMKVSDDSISTFTRSLKRKGERPCKKLVPFLGEQKQVGIHSQLLRLYLELGVKVTKVHRIWTWRSRAFMKDWVQGLADERAKTTDEATRWVIKICLNSVYGKTCEDKSGRTKTRLDTDMKKFLKNVGRFNTSDFDVISEAPFLGSTKQIIEKGIVLDSPRIVGWAILELSKFHMMRAWYMGIRKMWRNPTLLMTDTDSLIFKVQDSDPLKTMREAKNPNCLFDVHKKKQLGLFGIETLDIEEFVGLRAKMYSYKKREGKTDQRIKGIPGRIRPEHEHYKSILFNQTLDAHTVQFSQMTSKHHNVTIKSVCKKALSGMNDKVYQIDKLHSRPLGHWRNGVSRKEEMRWLTRATRLQLKLRGNRFLKRSTTEPQDSDSTTCPSRRDALSPRSDSS